MEILKVCDMEKEVMLLTGAGQIGMAIARRMGYGMKIVVGESGWRMRRPWLIR